MTSLESLIGGYREGILQPTSPYIIYCDAFWGSSYTDEILLTYGDESVDAKSKTFYKAYIEVLNNYIG